MLYNLENTEWLREWNQRLMDRIKTLYPSPKKITWKIKPKEINMDMNEIIEKMMKSSTKTECPASKEQLLDLKKIYEDHLSSIKQNIEMNKQYFTLQLKRYVEQQEKLNEYETKLCKLNHILNFGCADPDDNDDDNEESE